RGKVLLQNTTTPLCRYRVRQVINSRKRVAANRKFCCSLIGRSLLVCRGFWALTYDSVRLPCARYVKSTTPTLTLGRCAAALGRGTRRGDRHGALPYPASPCHL